MTDKEYAALCKARAKMAQWGQALQAIERLEQESAFILDLLSGLADTIGAQRLTGMPRGGGPGDPVSDAVEDMDRRREMYQRELDRKNKAIEKWMRLYREVQALIDAHLTNQQAEIVEMRYRNGWSWPQIASAISYSETGVRKQEQRALMKISRRI